MVGNEGPGVGAAVEGLEHGGFHLGEAAGVQEGADGGDDLRAAAEDLAVGGIEQQIQIAFAVAELDV